MNAEGYLQEINSINTELQRLNSHTKSLKLQKSRAMKGLYNYMIAHNLEKVGEGKNTITLKKCTPSEPRKKSKPKPQRKEDAINLFREVGIPDPERFYIDFEKTQKESDLQKDKNMEFPLQKSKGIKKASKEIDPFLGF
jgi:hypothetical protein